MATKKKAESVPPPAAESEAIELSDADDSGHALVVSGDDEWDFGSDARSGFKGLSRDEYSIPFYGLLQAGSEAVKLNQIEGARGGDFVNSLTKQLFKKLIVQPVHLERVVVEWAPRGSAQKIVARHLFNSAIVAEAVRLNGGSIIGTKDKPLKHGDNFLVDTRYLYFNRLAEDGLTVEGFGIMPFAKTKINPLKDATSAIDQAGLQAPLWSGRFVIGTKVETKAGESWHNVTFKAFGRENLMFDRTNLLSPRHPLYVAGRGLAESIIGGTKAADFESEAHVSDTGGGGETIDNPGSKRHF